MLSKIVFKSSLFKTGKFFTSEIKKYDYKDALLFNKLLTEEETMVLIFYIKTSSLFYFPLDYGTSKSFRPINTNAISD